MRILRRTCKQAILTAQLVGLFQNQRKFANIMDFCGNGVLFFSFQDHSVSSHEIVDINEFM